MFHFFDADCIAMYITLLTESSAGNTLRFLIACRIALLSDSIALVV